LRALFASKSLAEWRDILARQDGQWDVVQHVGEMSDDRQVQANGYLQTVESGDGRRIPLVSVPMQFDGTAFSTRRAPGLGSDSDALLGALGYDADAIIELKAAGVVF
jgi:crotonobetainyl-CoA:carnitine CoA-transferase CaiB-like acyl-CoA transferase